MNHFTDFLFARPSFLEGVARLLDFGGTLRVYNQSQDGQIADYIALASDVQAIGDDMRQAINQFVSENGDRLGSQTQ